MEKELRYVKWHVCTNMCGQISQTRIQIRFNNQRMIQIIKANIVKSDKCLPFVLSTICISANKYML